VLANRLFVFVQDTVKTTHSKVAHNWTAQHALFLKELHEKTRQKCLFEATDFAKSIEYLATHTDLLGEKDVPHILEAITKVRTYYTQSGAVNFSACHGDFTPWNMFFEQGRLFVFDWEYARLTYPPYMDRFHYFTQSCIFEKHWNADKIYNKYLSHKTRLKKQINNPDFSYMCYLLDIISRYTERDKGHYNTDMAHSLSVWINLVSRL
jgi:thiamine kinase-like enzyme